MTIEVKSVLICEDIRREDTGKLMLIGVYGRDIGFVRFPAAAAFRLSVRLETDKPIEGTMEFHCFLDDDLRSTTKGQIKIDRAGIAMLNTPPLILEDIESEALLTIKWTTPENDKLEQLFSIPIVDGSNRT